MPISLPGQWSTNWRCCSKVIETCAAHKNWARCNDAHRAPLVTRREGTMTNGEKGKPRRLTGRMRDSQAIDAERPMQPPFRNSPKFQRVRSAEVRVSGGRGLLRDLAL